jgi:hypothetical protein
MGIHIIFKATGDAEATKAEYTALQVSCCDQIFGPRFQKIAVQQMDDVMFYFCLVNIVVFYSLYAIDAYVVSDNVTTNIWNILTLNKPVKNNLLCVLQSIMIIIMMIVHIPIFVYHFKYIFTAPSIPRIFMRLIIICILMFIMIYGFRMVQLVPGKISIY